MASRKKKGIEVGKASEPLGGDDALLKKVPALAAYVLRVGAEQLNFRKFMVREYNEVRKHYYTEKCFIQINSDGTIYCTRAEHAPTKEEAEAIQAGVIKVDLPRSVGTSLRHAEQKMADLDSEARGKKLDEIRTYAFVSRLDGKVYMLQHIYRDPERGKQYIPWTFWSDGNWRRMEPDKKLPLWKPYKARGKTKLMIHEGAKCAAFADGLINDEDRADEKRAHPWASELEDYEHWGMIGGALAPQRTDYSEIARESYSEVVYVCDNDAPGNSALQVVSRYYAKGLMGVKFGKDFKESFDIAEKMPEKLFAGRGKSRRWTGPSMKDLMAPATWATEALPNPSGKGKRVHVLTRPFRDQWLHSVTPEVYVHRSWPHIMLTASEFNNKCAPYSDVEDTARLIRKDDGSKSAIIKYNPAKDPGIYGSGEDGLTINTYMKPSVKELPGSFKPWLDFMTYLIPNKEDRHHLFQWIATLVCRPQERMKYGVLLISETQGVGKGTLGEHVLTPLVGRLNVSVPSENDITESNFNYWMAHKRLAIVHEIYAGHSWKAYNRLKSVITEDYILINKKHMAAYQIDNWMHIFACSNSMKALRLDQSDRRWLLPRVTEDRRPAAYWMGFYGWLKEEGGIGIIKRWAKEYLEEHGHVLSGATAPWTSLKQEVVEASDSPGEERVRTVLRRIDGILKGEADDSKERLEEWASKGMLVDGKVVLLDVQLVRFIQEDLYQGKRVDYLEKPLTVRKLAKAESWKVGDQKVSTGMRAEGWREHPNGRIISNDEEIASSSPSDLGGSKVNGKVPKIKPLSLDWMREI